jgi:hypothetical protein
MKQKLIALINITIDTLLPNLLFVVSNVLLYFSINYDEFTGFNGSDWLVLFSILSFILMFIGSSILNQGSQTNKILGTFYISGNFYDVGKNGRDFFVAKKGDAGIGVMLSQYFINLIFSPLLILLWFIQIILILFNPTFTQNYNQLNDNSIRIKEPAAVLFIFISIVFSGLNTGILNYYHHLYALDQLSIQSTYSFERIQYRDWYHFEIEIKHPHHNYISSLVTVKGLLYQEESVQFNSTFTHIDSQEKIVLSMFKDNRETEYPFFPPNIHASELKLEIHLKQIKFVNGEYFQGKIFVLNLT